MNTLQETALGRAAADTVIRGGQVCLVEAGTIADRDVVIRDGRVAALPADAEDVIDDTTTVIEADGKPVLPGLIDAHTHVDVPISFERVYHHALEGGTTGVVTELNGIGSVFPVRGPEEFLQATDDIPCTVAATVPPQALFDLFEPRQADVETEAGLLGLLDHDRIVGVGEISWIYIVGRDDPVRTLCEAARERGKRVTAHGAGCKGDNLTALATVADDDHEPIAGEEIIERIENGLHVIGRYGSRDDIDAVVEAYTELGGAEMSLSTDGIGLHRMVTDGYMNLAVKRTIEGGVPPVDAVRMATLNPARHFGLTDRGSLSPGSYADIVIVEDFDSMAVETVLYEGSLVVQDGTATVEPKTYSYASALYDSIRASATADTFHVSASRASTDGDIRGIEFVGGMVTTETTLSPPIVDDALQADPAADILKAAIYDRTQDQWGFVGFISGFTVGADAMATTNTMQLPGVMVIGGDDAAMATAVNRLHTIEGGWVVVDDGEVQTELPQPIAGSGSELGVDETLDRQQAIFDALDVDRSDARVGLASLTFTGVPALKLTFSGYADVLRKQVRGLSLDEAGV